MVTFSSPTLVKVMPSHFILEAERVIEREADKKKKIDLVCGSKIISVCSLSSSQHFFVCGNNAVSCSVSTNRQMQQNVCIVKAESLFTVT